MGLRKIEAIKHLRNEWPEHFNRELELREAKTIVELVEPFIFNEGDELRQDELNRARARVASYMDAMHMLLRLVDYFVAHPEEYASWKEAS